MSASARWMRSPSRAPPRRATIDPACRSRRPRAPAQALADELSSRSALVSIKVTEVRKGMVLQMDGELWVVTRYDHITPGNWRAINQVYLRNIRTGSQK